MNIKHLLDNVNDINMSYVLGRIEMQIAQYKTDIEYHVTTDEQKAMSIAALHAINDILTAMSESIEYTQQYKQPTKNN